MDKLLNIDTLALFLYFVVPGFVAMRVYDLMVPAERRNFGNSLIEVISYSMFNLVLLFWPIALINRPEFRSAHPVWYYSLTFGIVFISPVCLAIVFRVLLSARWLRRWVLDPTPTAWDFFFGQRQPSWVRFQLKSGKMVGGYYGDASYASSFPQRQEIYVEEVWRLDHLGRFVRRSDQTAGAIISREECELIEFLTVGAANHEREQQPEERRQTD